MLDLGIQWETLYKDHFNDGKLLVTNESITAWHIIMSTTQYCSHYYRYAREYFPALCNDFLLKIDEHLNKVKKDKKTYVKMQQIFEEVLRDDKLAWDAYKDAR